MRFHEQLNALKRLHALIQRASTGTPDSLARRFEKSKSSINRLIGDLKELGAPIIYSSERESYIYEEPFDLIF